MDAWVGWVVALLTAIGALIKIYWPLKIQGEESRGKSLQERLKARRDENAELFRRSNEIIDRLEKQVNDQQETIARFHQLHTRCEVELAAMKAICRELKRTMRRLQAKAGETPDPVEPWEAEGNPLVEAAEYATRTTEHHSGLLREVLDKEKAAPPQGGP